MDMFIDYIKEREGKSAIVTDHGFMKYAIEKDVLYIEDIYVKPEFRHLGHGQQMASGLVDMAKAKGCKKLMGSVVPSTKGAQKSMLNLMQFGMNLHSAYHDRIFFIKEI